MANQPPSALAGCRAFHGRILAGFFIFGGRFFDLLERHLLVLVLRRVQGRAGVAAVEERVADRLVAVMNQLHVQLRRDRRGADVRHVMAHIDHIVAALEGKRLGQLDAALHRFHHQLDLLAVGQRTHARLHRETGVVRRERTADQAGLRQVGVVCAFVEQHFVLLAFVRLAPLEQAEATAKPARIARALEFEQFQTLDLATQCVDIDLDDIGGNGDALALESARIGIHARQGCRAGGRQGGRCRSGRRLGGLGGISGEHRRAARRNHPFVPENYQRDGEHDPQDGTFIDIH